jgi:integrase
MSSRSPFLQRRGFSLNFRIAVPADLRAAIGLREVSRALPTTSKTVGALLALQAAVTTKSVFAEVRAARMDMDENKLAALMAAAKEKIKHAETKEQHFADLVADQSRYNQELKRIRLEAEHGVARARLEGENAGLRRALALRGAAAVPSPSKLPPSAPDPAAASSPQLGKVVEEFLKRYHRDKAAMRKKHEGVLPLFLDVVGDKPVSAMKQGDINRFFDIVQKLPPRWSDECLKQGVSAEELANQNHAKTIAPKTFDDTYKACIRSFLDDARTQWQDVGFPTTLTTNGNSYRGVRKEDEGRQRAFTDEEVQRLFHGPELVSFHNNPSLEHQFWLPYVGLYTGARVNEICQINPQKDVLQDSKSGIWYLQITEDSEGDERITKSVKNKSSVRKVPIHSRLVALGFRDYVDRMKTNGAKLLFPGFRPGRGKASSGGEKWFREFLRDIGLRDDTAGARLVGMHAFRHTLMHKAHNCNPPLDVTSITGHRGDTDSVVAGYQGELSLVNKQRILEAVQFGL